MAFSSRPNCYVTDAQDPRSRYPPGYFARSDADPVLEHAYAGASWVTVLDEESYLFLSDRRDGLQQNQGHVGRSLWRHWRESGRRPELLLSAAGGIVSYAAAAGNGGRLRLGGCGGGQRSGRTRRQDAGRADRHPGSR